MSEWLTDILSELILGLYETSVELMRFAARAAAAALALWWAWDPVLAVLGDRPGWLPLWGLLLGLRVLVAQVVSVGPVELDSEPGLDPEMVEDGCHLRVVPGPQEPEDGDED